MEYTEKILLVDDDTEILKIYKQIFELNGFQILTVTNAEEALKIVDSYKVAVVITDIIMPEKDGIETILDLRRTNPGLKVIAISGGGRSTPDNYLQSAKLLGADRAIRKPFTNEEILTAVDELTRVI